MKPTARLALAVALFALAVPHPAVAAEPPDLALGYSRLSLDDDSRHGIGAALSFNAFGLVRIWLDASTHQGTESGVDLSATTLMAGPGLRMGTGTVRVFGRAMAGLVRERASISVLDADIAETESGLGALIGGGLDFKMSEGLGLRLQGDYLWRDSESVDGSSGWRAGAAVVYRFGKGE